MNSLHKIRPQLCNKSVENIETPEIYKVHHHNWDSSMRCTNLTSDVTVNGVHCYKMKCEIYFISTAVVLCNVPSKEINKSTRDIAHIVFKLQYILCIPVGCVPTACLLAGGMHTLVGVHLLEGGASTGGGMLPLEGCIHWRKKCIHCRVGASTGWGASGGSIQRGLHPGSTLPSVNRMTHTCENVTFPHTPYAVSKDYALRPVYTSINDWFGEPSLTLASFLISWGCNTFLKSFTWFIKNSKPFNQSDIPNDIDAGAQCKLLNFAELWSTEIFWGVGVGSKLWSTEISLGGGG